MRSRGWARVTPSSDEEAISRILTAVDEEVAEHGAAIRLADVARRLGVTRQTVYRYPRMASLSIYGQDSTFNRGGEHAMRPGR